MNNSKIYTIKLCTILATLLLLFVLLVSSLQFVCYDLPHWWEHEYTKHNSLKYVNGEMSMADAVNVTDSMLSYCIGEVDSLDAVTATIDGKTRPFFSEREKTHLADCRTIFTNALKFRRYAVIVMLLLFGIIFLIYRLNHPNRLSYAKIVAIYFQRTTIASLSIASLFAIFCALNFDKAFDIFHKIFFNNDYWILNPNKDELINLMRIGVFSDTAILSTLIWLALVVILLAISHRTLTTISRASSN